VSGLWGGGGGHYNEWADFLERWGAGEMLDASRLPLLPPEVFAGETWERFGKRLTGAVSDRLKSWSTALTRAMGEARDEFAVARTLTQARDGLRTIRALVAHPSLPPDVSQRLGSMVDSQIKSAQEMLEKSVFDAMRSSMSSRSLLEARLRTIRDNSLVVTTTEDGRRAAAGPSAWAFDPTAPAKRRVIPR
jgi:hypothetical protein